RPPGAARRRSRRTRRGRRPGAPLTAYLLGLAVGRGVPARDAAARLTEMAEGWRAEVPEQAGEPVLDDA
ncbi:DUF6457 domain-containing protein, partial [Actinomadura sp. NPDC048032]|uniref:DUF6457 domain-containing protein n=1 Tax=Actinomadura sp. NPDC048032 TaxID=3155747 RepID=UPI00341011C2